MSTEFYIIQKTPFIVRHGIGKGKCGFTPVEAKFAESEMYVEDEYGTKYTLEEFYQMRVRTESDNSE